MVVAGCWLAMSATVHGAATQPAQGGHGQAQSAATASPTHAATPAAGAHGPAAAHAAPAATAKPAAGSVHAAQPAVAATPPAAKPAASTTPAAGAPASVAEVVKRIQSIMVEEAGKPGARKPAGAAPASAGRPPAASVQGTKAAPRDPRVTLNWDQPRDSVRLTWDHELLPRAARRPGVRLEWPE
jgi:hypothetical protein